jgi:hypothetical protein
LSSTYGGTIGEAIAVLRTAKECPSWNNASDDYIQAQALYASKSLNRYARRKIIPNNVVQDLNNTFRGCASFKIINNKISTSLFLQECVISGKDLRNPKNK